MKLYTQNRSMIIEMPARIWVTSAANKGCIVTSNSFEPIIAVYDTEERALEVLKEMFSFYRNGKNSYILPKE